MENGKNNNFYITKIFWSNSTRQHLDRPMLNLLMERCLGRKIMRIIFLIHINGREILMDALRVIVNNLFLKKNLLEKKNN